MRPRSGLLLLYLLCIVFARAETWRTLSGETFEAKLSGVYGPLAVFSEPRGSRQLVVEALDDAGVARVADFLRNRSPEVAWSASTSLIARALRGRLVTLREGRLTTFEPERNEPEIYLIYFGAGWSESTRRFNPELMARYGELKQVAGAKFELIYLGQDREPSDHTTFVREVEMPWPLVRFSALGTIPLVERWNVGAPSLVALTPDAEVIFFSERADRAPVSPTELLAEFGALLSMMRDESVAGKRSKHRLAVLQHVRSRPTGEHPPQPYVVEIDRSRYHTLEEKRVVATLELDQQGRVTNATIDPPQGAVIRDQFEQDARRWLFLPSVSGGTSRPFTVKLPIEF